MSLQKRVQQTFDCDFEQHYIVRKWKIDSTINKLELNISVMSGDYVYSLVSTFASRSVCLTSVGWLKRLGVESTICLILFRMILVGQA